MKLLISPIFITIKNWFTPPVFEDQDKTLKARNSFFLAIVGFTISIFIFIVFLLFSPENTLRLFIIGVSILFSLLPVALLRKGYIQATILLQAGIIWVGVVTTSFSTGGIHSIGFIGGTIAALLVMGIALEYLSALIFIAMSILAAGILAWAEGQGLINPARVFEKPVVLVATYASFLFVLTGLLYTTYRSVNQALTQARIEITERKRIEKEHEHVIHKLEAEIIERQRVEEKFSTSEERLEILHEIDRALLSATSTHAIATNALVRIRKLIPCPRASVSLFDFNKNEGVFLAADLDVGNVIWDHALTLQEYGEHIITELQQNKPFIMNDVLNDPRAVELDYELAKEGIHSWLYLPLLYQGQLIGALNLGRGPEKHFTTADAETAQDVANQLAIAIQQSRLHTALENELTERQNLITQLEANNAELEQFTYTVSHDLRSPLVTIKGFLGMLKQDLQANETDKVEKDYQRIASATDKMDELLFDLLELSRIGRIVNPSEEVNLLQLTQDVLEALDARLRSKNVTVLLSPDLPIVYCDRIRLREVLQNLIDNAAKYASAQTDPKIEIGTRHEAGEQIIFVKDNGIGVESKYHTRIFNLFEKLNPIVEGTGIGLALVKRIIEVHGGKVWVESDGLGKGSTFCFTIPDGRQTT